MHSCDYRFSVATRGGDLNSGRAAYASSLMCRAQNTSNTAEASAKSRKTTRETQMANLNTEILM